MTEIAFVTYSKRPDITADDLLAAQKLRQLGIEVVAAPWDEPSVEWKSFDQVILRSPWNYFLKYPEFLRWLASLPVPVLNSKEIVRWNSSKTYLSELEAKGIAIVPTRFIAPRNLDAEITSLAWKEAVLKPAVSADGFMTQRFSGNELIPGHAKLLPYLRLDCPVMAQPYMPEIASNGEWSYIFIEGAFSHSVLKKPANGDFRVQGTYGGITTPLPPRELQAAARVMSVLPSTPLYARVDMIESGGKMLLGELEVIEPSLYFEGSPGSALKFAEAIRARLS